MEKKKKLSPFSKLVKKIYFKEEIQPLEKAIKEASRRWRKKRA